MRILGIGSSCDLGEMYLRLSSAGHDVRVYIEDFEESGTMAGLVDRVESWQSQLGWIREAGSEGVIVFESANHGELQDALRTEGFAVIGGCAEGDRLENDREYGQSVLAAAGLRVPATHTFASFDSAIDYVHAHPGRYAFKLNGGLTASWRTYIGVAADGSDLIAWLQSQRTQLPAIGLTNAQFVLSSVVIGVETGVGAFFNGERFLQPACLDWEHKRFCNGDLGELTGEMGTVVTYRGAEVLFERTLAKLGPHLRERGYVGYINLNTIINQDGVWPLELTCRFGYPGYAILDALQLESWAEMFQKLLRRDAVSFATRPGFAVGVVLTVPPFPYRFGYREISKGMPISFYPELQPDERERIYLGEVARAGDRLVASGSIGYLMVATGVGADVEAAQRNAYALAQRVIVPNLRYRTDIGSDLVTRGRTALRELGYLP